MHEELSASAFHFISVRGSAADQNSRFELKERDKLKKQTSFQNIKSRDFDSYPASNRDLIPTTL
jgi:hypothetical protein